MFTLENEIRRITSHYDGLSYIDAENSGEGTEFGISIDYIDTLNFNDSQYEEWEDLLNTIDIIRDNFQIYCSWDRSGYNYWTLGMQESNYTHIVIWVNEDFEDSDINPMFDEIDKIINKIEEFYFSIKND
jgi:hypothetical protein